MKKHAKKLITLLLVVALLIPTFAMIYTNAATGDTVELAFNNLFVFEKWASNKLSTTVQVATDNVISTEGATLTTDVTNGSFTLAKTCTTNSEVFTAFSMGDTFAENGIYYMIDVKPNTTYKFSYNLSGDVAVFTPYVFMYTDAGAYSTNQPALTTTLGDNSFTFTTGSDIAYIQVRFTINGTTAASTATVKNISISKYEVVVDRTNLFVFDEWASSTKSTASHSYYDDGKVTPNTETDTLRFTTNTGGTTGILYTDFTLEKTAGANDGFYQVDVEPSTAYTFNYFVTNVGATPATHFEVNIVRINESGGSIDYLPFPVTGYGANTFTFETTADTETISVVFDVQHGNADWIFDISEIGIYKTTTTDYTFTPHRQAYTEGAGNYTNLPTPTNIPEGKVFAGWCTTEDGTGDLITSDTKISHESFTVYPKYETKLDEGGLKIDTPATKLTYTLGEKVNTAGLVLEATVTSDGGTNIYKINSGYRYSPDTVATTAGTQTITVYYGGQSVSYDVTVVDSITKSVSVNDVATDVSVTNDEYFINLTGTDFNRYQITYYSDAYVKGILKTTATDGSTVSEEFFLEPSTSGSFVSFIDGFIDGTYYTNISSISFEPLNKDFFTFKLDSVETIFANRPTDNMQYQQDNTHKVGIDLSKGGALTYIEELSGNVVASYYGEGIAAQVDYKNMISGGTQISENVNLINRHDPGRYVQQSYYGTREDPYVTGDYNGVEWNYNPVQGGNYMFESSKIVDYRITSNEIYVKARPLDWGKYSDEFANSKEGDWTDNDGDGVLDEGELVLDPRYGDEYITDSYMEAWYVFEDDMVKTYCRFVDYSGYPSATTTQELPAFYCVEPLNTFAYYQGDTVWEAESEFDYAAKAYTENEPDFWGVSAKYNNMLKANGKETVTPWVDNAENWAAFMGSDNENSFGIGIYSAGVTEFHYGTYPQIYKEPAEGSTTLTAEQFDNADMYEDGVVTMPDMQDATSYIAPVGTMTFESYSPYTYSYYIASGTLHDIREDFRRAKTQDDEAAVAGADIAVPETAYMTPSGSDATSKIGLYYVNNIIDATNNYDVVTVAERSDTMSFGVHINGATKFTVDITNVTNPSDDIDLYNADGNEVANTYEFALGEHTGSATFDENYTLRFNTTGLAPNGKATAKWIITGYDSAGNVVGTYTAYTVMYAPGLTIGAVAEGRITSGSNHEISSWITGTNGIDHSQRAPLGSFEADYHDSGRFIYDPLVYPEVQTPANAGSQSEDDYIITTDTEGTTDDYGDNAYVLQTATKGANSSRSQSYLGLLKIDKSRYTNTNQIPNLQIGFDALRISSDENNSLQNYDTYYVLGTSESYTATSLSEAPSGWTHHSSYTDTNSKKAVPFRETVTPAYAVTDDIDGKYIHALNQGMATYSLAGNNYSTAGSSVLISLTDKSGLRDSVTTGYGLADEDYIGSTYDKFLEELEDAATVLGDPSADQISIDNAQKELDDAIADLINIRYSLKYDNLFSAYEFSLKPTNMTMNNKDATATVGYSSGAITVTSAGTAKEDVYTMYDTSENSYLITLEANTSYVFEYDVDSLLGSQAFLFFYDATTLAGVKVSNRSVQVGSGNPSANTEDVTHFGNYSYGPTDNHYVMRFTTPSSPIKVGFRFGNTNNNSLTPGTDGNISTFSNIRLIDSARYYADATYSKTEDVFEEFASYGTLVTPVRPGYTFSGWKDEIGNAVTGASIAENNLSIFSEWTENSYTVVYDLNGGSGTAPSMTKKYTDSFSVQSANGLSKPGYALAGWSTDPNATTAQYTPGQMVSGLSTENNSTVTLYAVWEEAWVNVTFDNRFDLNAFNISTSALTINERTATGFKVTSKSGNDANTGFSYSIDIEPGKTYVLTADIDFTPDVSGHTYDMYVHTLNSSGASDTSSTPGSGVNVQSGCYFVKQGTASADNVTLKFTAGTTATQVKIRFDANYAGSVLAVDNIRFFEDLGITVKPVNKAVQYLKTFGELPVPTRAGYTFQGWYTADGKQITATSTLEQLTTVNLFSKWVINDDALTADKVAIDFASPVKFKPLDNDTILAAAGTTNTLLGFSKDGGTSYTSTVTGTYGKFSFSGTEVTYAPSAVIDGTDEVYYYVSDGTTTIKNKIIIVPASNILYEEDKLTVSNTKGVAWSAAGSAGSITQSNDNIYGYDASYNTYSIYSNSSAKTVTVDSENNRSQILTFTFKGTGFDLYGACGATTGVQLITIKNNDTGKMVKSIIVDTYYNDTYGTLYQVPIVCENNLDYASYTVQVMASYLPSFSGALNTQSVTNNGTMTVYTASENEALADALAEIGMEGILRADEVSVVWFDDDSIFNGGEGVSAQADDTVATAATVTELYNVIDAIRVYNPLEEGDAYSYYSDTEAGAQYYNVMDNLINGGSISNGGADGLFGYVMGNPNGSLTLETYESDGPKDELYLSGTTSAVVFKINNFTAGTKVMISLRAAYATDSANPKVKVGSGEMTITSNTEMYYDITEYVDEATGTVTIQNTTAGTLLSIGYVKLVGENIEVASTFSLDTARAMMAAPAEEVDFNAPKTEPEATPDEDAGAESDDSAEEKWYVTLLNKIFSFFAKAFDFFKNIFSKVFSLFSY